MGQSQLAFVFPGQGSQSVGMLAELAAREPVVREAFAEASEGAGIDLWTLSQEGPEEQLNRTEFTQPALLAAGVAVWRAWQRRGGAQPALLAGHSLGEYSALVAAGTLSLGDGARLVRLRGQLMQEERLLVQTGPRAQAMGPLDLQHQVVVKNIGTRLPTSLINAGNRRAAHDMAMHEVQHRPLIQHGVSGIGLAVYITGEHDTRPV